MKYHRFILAFLSFFVGGGVYSTIMAVFDYFDGNPFSLKDFALHWIFMGLFWVVFNLFYHRKKNQDLLNPK